MTDHLSSPFLSASLSRRTILSMGAAALASLAAPEYSFASTEFSGSRPALADRRFRSSAIEAAITDTGKRIADIKLRAIFEQCLPNTLDTTVFPSIQNNYPDTFVITGDIDAMWLRDSSAQMWPYLRFVKQDAQLANLIEGVVRRHARLVLIDSYANAFTRDSSVPGLSWTHQDKTEMKAGVAERKWEIDSLCYVIRMAHGYWTQTGNSKPFDATWKAAAWKIVNTFKEQQRLQNPGPYSFTRPSAVPSDTLPLSGYGNPATPVGLIYSMFRPSDDACIYPLFIPANLFAATSLEQLQKMALQIFADKELAAECETLIQAVRKGLNEYGKVHHSKYGEIWAFEVDGYGNSLMMDDANAPSLLSLPYLGCCNANDPLYQRTRRFVLSLDNPYFFKGSAAEGIGGPHIGLSYIWPLSIIMRALTSNDDQEILQCLKWLRDTTGGTGFMHEAFHKDDATKFTRSWFAWANTLFGELILNLAENKPALLRQRFS